MSTVAPAPKAVAGAIHPPAIAIRELWPWLLLGAALFAVALYLVGSFQGSPWLHELLHDGRHLLGFPCH